MTEKQYGKKIDDVDDSIIVITHNGNDFAWFLNDVCTDEQVDKIVQRLNDLSEESGQLKKELKRCKDWINSDKNDYELTLAFIKNKGYSLKDVLEYEKELQND